MPVDDALIQMALDAHGATAVDELRTGGQKTVRLVRQGTTDLVMKVIAVDSGLPDALRRAQREVELLQRVDSPHVVKVASDLVELDDPVRGAAWLEEYLDGEDLVDLVGTEWTADDATAMAKDVAVGLAELHKVKVVHRDLSAANVRRLSNGRFVVMDPGFARHPLRSDLTVGGQPGTAGYLSPEHLHSYSGAPTPASDVFSVGILLFLALTGQLPIPYTGDVSDYISRLSRAETLDLDQLRPDVPEALRSLVKRCLHPQSARRPLNGRRLLEALEAIE
jgi:serine/threonine-protein kinase